MLLKDLMNSLPILMFSGPVKPNADFPLNGSVRSLTLGRSASFSVPPGIVGVGVIGPGEFMPLSLGGIEVGPSWTRSACLEACEGSLTVAWALNL